MAKVLPPAVVASFPAVVSKGARQVPADITPEIMQIILLDEIAGRQEETEAHLARLRALEDDRSPEGLTDEIEISVDSTLKEVLTTDNWQSISITNDGPDTVRIKINLNTTAIRWKKLKIDEIYEVNFHEHKIKKLFLVCDLGQTATLRVAGKF